MPSITSIRGREILDSRGNPTIEVTVRLGETAQGTASVPSGASTGIHEAIELRDKDPGRYGGMGALAAVALVNGEITQALVGKSFDQHSLDKALIALDDTPNKSRLGANAILGVSMAFARAAADEIGIELFRYIGELANNKSFRLPQPMFNVINGGKHADSGLDVQEFMIGPSGFGSVSKSIEAASAVIRHLKKELVERGLSTGVGDEGGFAPKIGSTEEALDLLVGAVRSAGYREDQVLIGMDVAASSFFEDGKYLMRKDGETARMDADAMLAWYEKLIDDYPIASVEDAFAEDDWEAFARFTEAFGRKVTVVGDDLTVTNKERIAQASEKRAVNSVLIKLNQIGTVSETLDAIMLTEKNGWKPFISHRSGETEDTFIADLAVGVSAPYIKAGSLARGERIAKYNRLMEIEGILSRVS